MLYFNLISLLFFVCGAVILAVQTPAIAFSARVYPLVLIVSVTVCCLVIAAKEIAGRATTAKLDAKLAQILFSPAWLRIRVFAFLVVWLIYSALISQVGFIVATSCALAISLWLLGVRRIVLDIVTSVLFSLAFAILFATVLYIPTPSGPLDQLLTQAIYAIQH